MSSPQPATVGTFIFKLKSSTSIKSFLKAYACIQEKQVCLLWTTWTSKEQVFST